MILVVGATGTLGFETCRLIAEAGLKVRALVRESSDQDRVNELRSLGVTIVRGDLKDRDSLFRACDGVNAVVSTATSTSSRHEGDGIDSVDRDGQLDLIRAAKSAGVDQFVFVSFPEMDSEFPLQNAKRAAEAELKTSGLGYTVLQPTFFMEVWLSPALGFDIENGLARIYGSGENKISWISYRDVAKFIVAALNNPRARNVVIELGGPEQLSPAEVVSILERTTGKKFNVEYVPEKALKEQKEASTDAMEQTFTGLMLGYAAGQEIDTKPALQALPVRLTSVEEYARSFSKTSAPAGSKH